VAKGLTFHGLRHTVATELRELRFDNRTIADMLGQKSEATAAHYSRDADLQDKLKPAVEQMEIADETRTKVSRIKWKMCLDALCGTDVNHAKILICLEEGW